MKIDRRKVKDQGWSLVNKGYWLNVGAFAIVTAIIGGLSGTYSISSSGVSITAKLPFADDFDPTAILLFLMIGFVFFIITALIFVTSAMMYGVFRYGAAKYSLKKIRGEETSIKDIFSGFQKFGTVAKAGILVHLYIMLWSFLFFVPGIIKSFSYSQTFYLLADDPKLSASEAITKSRQIMDGYKWNRFVLGLSLLGWNILNGMSGGIAGVFWINPYIEFTYAGYYNELNGGQKSSDETINVEVAEVL